MKVIKEVSLMQSTAEYYRCAGKKIGFIPTMGYLHDGHISLIKKAKKESEVVIVSIFVNPTQFLQGEDLEKYPRDFERDSLICENEGVNYIFYPEAHEMYLPKNKTEVIVKDISEKLEGKYRPGHFTGVATVVLKLFNIVKPHFAYFGQKDAQQVVVIKKMIKDFNVDVQLQVGETLREMNGLAMSSRNVYLSAIEKDEAKVLFFVLNELKKKITDEKIYDINSLKKYAEQIILKSAPDCKLQYLEITDNDELDEIKNLKNYNGDILISLAAFFGKTRLIDNILFAI